jgi:gas vesicle protein
MVIDFKNLGKQKKANSGGVITAGVVGAIAGAAIATALSDEKKREALTTSVKDSATKIKDQATNLYNKYANSAEDAGNDMKDEAKAKLDKPENKSRKLSM